MGGTRLRRPGPRLRFGRDGENHRGIVRAAFLARKHPEARVLLATFSDTLAKALQTRVKRLTCHEPKLSERLEVHSLDALGNRLYKLHMGPAKPVLRPALVGMVKAASPDFPV